MIENERRFREIIDALPVAIYTTDVEGRLTHFNPAAVEFSGRMPEVGTDYWCVTWKLYHPDGTPMPHDTSPMAVALKEGRSIHGEEAIAEHSDGKRIWFEAYPSPLHDDEGKIVGGINMLIDITERKHSEHSNALLGAIVNGSDDGIISKNLDGVITSWNAGAERLFGYTAQEAIGQSVTILIPAGRIDEETEILKRLKRGERVDHFETVRLRKDGTPLDISLTISPMWDSTGRIVGASKIARDITRRERAEEALRKSEEQLQAIYDSTFEYIGLIAPDGTVIDCNRSSLEFAGNAREDVVGLPFWETPWFANTPGAPEELRESLAHAAAGEFVRYEIPLRRPSGEIITFDFSLHPVRNEHGEVVFIVPEGRDITERKQVEEAIRDLNETLEERVEERTAALLSYQDQLRALAAQLSKAEEQERHRIAADLHDNLGQILAVCKMKIDLLQKHGLPDQAASGMVELAELMDEANRYTRELMSDLKPPPALDKKDMRAAMDWVANKMKKHDLNVTIEDDKQSKPLSEEVQATLLQSVRELLFNVVKHAFVNEARIILSRLDKQVQVIVEDKGKGFKLEDKDPVPTENGGFGLFNIRERMNLLGGSLGIDSEPGRGTRVTLYAPVEKDDDDTPVRAYKTISSPLSGTPIQTGSGPKIRVMLVDDHHMMREGLRRIIEGEDDLMVVAEASDGKEGVKLARETAPDVVVMDVNMPKMNGIEATRKIKSEAPDVHIIGLSLHNEENIVRAMRSAGASAYLTKEEAFETLCATIRNEALMTKSEY